MIRTTVVSLRIDWDDEFSSHPTEWDYLNDLGIWLAGESIEIVESYDI